MISRWEVLFWMGLAVLLALVPWVTKRKPETPVDQWTDVYRTCVGSYPTDQQRAACIAAADRVLACAGQKEGKHE